MRRLFWILTFLLAVSPATLASGQEGAHRHAPAVRVEAAGRLLLEAGAAQARELSGLAWAGPDPAASGGHIYYAVSDSRPAVFRLLVHLDGRTGAVREARVLERIELDRGADCEDLVLDPRDGTLCVADETEPSVRQFRLITEAGRTRGKMVRELEAPPVFRSRRPNLGFEALAMDPEDHSLWTANEEALPGDGEPSGPETGTVVRLLRFGPDGRPREQFGYLTEPAGTRPPRGHPRERSGLVALSVLPGGRLLALERALDVQRLLIADAPVFRSRLFLVDTLGATDLSALDGGLKGREYTPARKTLLWEKTFGLEAPNNFEGMALGPRLEDGSVSLLLVSDDENGVLEQSLLGLRVYTEEATPSRDAGKQEDESTP